MNKYLSSMKKNYIYGILIILLIASIILGYFLYKEKREYAITTQNQYNFALYELIDYVGDKFKLKNLSSIIIILIITILLFKNISGMADLLNFAVTYYPI